MARQNGTTRSSQQSRSSSGGAGGASGSSPRREAAPSRRGGRSRSQRSKRESGGGSQPRQQAQSSRSSRRGVVAGAGAKAVGTVRDNPIPAALIGAGLTWLLVKNRQRLPAPHMPERLTGLADAARESFSGAAQTTRHAVRDGVGTAAESVKDGAATLAEYAQSGAAKVGQAAKKGYRKGRNTVATTWDEHPLAVGLGLLAAGVAAGMLLPAPKGETITRAARKLSDRVTSTGEELLGSARNLVTSSARAASREAKRQGLMPNQLGRKVKRVANAATP